MLLVVDNPERIKLVVAWTNLNIKPDKKLTKLKGESENEIWEWLWENARYSPAELKEKSRIGSEVALDGKGHTIARKS